MNTSKKIFSIFLLSSFLLLLFSGFCFAQKKLEIEYPTVPGVAAPTTTKTALPEYLRYVFTLSIMIAGILAFVAMVMGGIKYVISAGAPAAIADAKDQITSGILGLIILLSSYLILNTINPQLVLPEKPPLQPSKAGIRIYTVGMCCETADDKSLCEDESSFKVTTEVPDLTNPDLNWGFDGNKIESIKFLGNPGDLTVNLWSDKIFKGTKTSVDYLAGETDCKPVSVAVKSISLDYHFPGVYLYPEDNCAGDPVIYQASSATLPEFDNKTQSIKFIYGDKDPKTGEYGAKYAAVLHENENFMGEAALFDQEQNICLNLSAVGGLTSNPSDYPGKYSSLIGISYCQAQAGARGNPCADSSQCQSGLTCGELYACCNPNHSVSTGGWCYCDDECATGNCGGTTSGGGYCVAGAPPPPPGGHGYGSDLSGRVSSITVYLKPAIKDGQPQIVGQGVKFWGDKNYTKEKDDVEIGYYGDGEIESDLRNVNGKDVNDKISSMEMDGHYIALLCDGADFHDDCEVFTSSCADFRNHAIGQCGWWGRGDCLSSFIIKARK